MTLVRRTAMALLLALAAAAPARGQDDDEDGLPDGLRPGLAARYADAEGRVARRIDPALAFDWGSAAPDERVAADFSARWEGRLFTIPTGAYRLHLFAAGEVKVTLAGEVVLDAGADDAGWLACKPVALSYGYHPLAIEYRKTGAHGRLGLYWEGPQFKLESVPERHLYYDDIASPDDRFARGRMLVRALRCGACHDVPGDEVPLAAADLTRLAGNLRPGWLVDWLAAPAAAETTGGEGETAAVRRMPHFELAPADAAAVAAYLFARSRAAPKPPADPAPAANLDQGRQTFRTIGCLACHRAERLGESGLFGGGDLSAVARKRPADFFVRWLAEPAQVNPVHRMPVFRLEEQERIDLAGWLATLGRDGPDTKDEQAPPPADDEIARGAQLAARLRCVACHKLPDAGDPPALLPISAGALPSGGCLEGPQDRPFRPGYALASADRAAVVEYLSAMAHAPRHDRPHADGAFVLAERNCLGCHARGHAPGLAGQLDRVVEADRELAPLLPALAPPALFGVGDKLTAEALDRAIAARDPPLRPWLAVRMPTFTLGDAERQALVAHLVAADRIPDLPAPALGALPHPSEAALAIAGRRLVTADGFGCTSCHPIGEHMPRNVALNARGSDLSLLGRRLRPAWFDRWVRNPARIVPRMEMPSIQLPIRGVLDERLDDQLAAVWSVLNVPGFTPPPADAIRVVRASGADDDPGRRGQVVTDVLEAGDRVFVKPLVIGLPNRHNVLVDLEANRLAGWWIGDTARQRTRQKSWYWEPAGTMVWPIVADGSDLLLVRDGRREPPEPGGQFATECDAIEALEDGVRFTHRLRFPGREGDDGPVTIHVTQEFQALEAAEGGATGFRRQVSATGLSEGCGLVVAVTPGEQLKGVPSQPGIVPAEEATGHWGVYGRVGGLPRIADDERTAWIPLREFGHAAVGAVYYVTTLPVDRYYAPALELAPAVPARLDCVPGFDAVRLPLADSIMPTGLAWRADGTLAFTSLKGQVHVARDADGDGLEETLATFADGLAAPYGLAAAGDDLDVIHKPALVRLSDVDGDGRAERAETIASGWGHTADYHDWAVGLPRDAAGNYYLGLPCQQDDRSEAAAHLRGTVVKLAPREATPNDPRRFAVEALAGGLRFPMGLTLGPAEDLFVTDNQGNYNPFNELNHIVAGRRYGFVNKREQAPGFEPPFEAPAVDIPHPLTRSVNGIAFLITPPAVLAAGGGPVFGPFEGQLVGCEYDSRALVRMSLERVGDTWQGAVYPFTTAAAAVPTVVAGPEVASPAGGSGDSAQGDRDSAIAPASTAEAGNVLEGPVVCAVSPAGDLYVGNMRDSGWGGGANTGSIVRLRPSGPLPLGIAEVRVAPEGFDVRFTGPVEAEAAERIESYSVSSYRRVATAAYGGPDLDRRDEPLRGAALSPDRTRVRLTLDPLRTGFVYEIRVQALGAAGEELFPAEAHYTVRRR
jgi:mono/diheme cytochrome c family protein